jgi:hypothetical protein
MRDYCKTVREYVSLSEWESISSCFDKHYEWITCSAYASIGTVWQNEMAEVRRGFSQTAHITGNLLFWIEGTFSISRHNLIGNKFLFVYSKYLSDFRLLINTNIRLNQCKKAQARKWLLHIYIYVLENTTECETPILYSWYLPVELAHKFWTRLF